MIDHSVSRMILKRVPNYHLVSCAFLKGCISVCPCRMCENSEIARDGKHLYCKRVAGRLFEENGWDCSTSAYAFVAENGTCDAAKWPQDDYANFRLESEAAK